MSRIPHLPPAEPAPDVLESELADIADLELEDTSMLADDEVVEVVLHLEVGSPRSRGEAIYEEPIIEEELDPDDLVAIEDN